MYVMVPCDYEFEALIPWLFWMSREVHALLPCNFPVIIPQVGKQEVRAMWILEDHLAVPQGSRKQAQRLEAVYQVKHRLV